MITTFSFLWSSCGYMSFSKYQNTYFEQFWVLFFERNSLWPSQFRKRVLPKNNKFSRTAIFEKSKLLFIGGVILEISAFCWKLKFMLFEPLLVDLVEKCGFGGVYLAQWVWIGCISTWAQKRLIFHLGQQMGRLGRNTPHLVRKSKNGGGVR